MPLLLTWVVPLLLAAASRVAAQDPAVAAGISAGVAASSGAPPPGYRPLSGEPLEDWIDPNTGTTSRLAEGCGGITVELVLSGRPGGNFLEVMVSNASGAPVAFAAQATTVRFASGRLRRMRGRDGRAPGGDVVVEDGFWVHTTLAFPDKADFRDEDAMTLRLAFAATGRPPCSLPVVIERDASIPQDAATYLPRSALELHFEGGPRFFASGGVEGLGGASGASFGLDTLYFPWVYQGLGFAVALDAYDGDRASMVAPGRAIDEPHLSGAGFLLGYAMRYYLAPWLGLSYEGFSGPYVFELTDGQDSGVLENGLVFPLRSRARVKARFLRLADGSEFYFSTSLVHLWVPYGEIGQLKTAGHSLGLMFAIGIGG